jgi:hypothetical protein
MQDRRHFYKTRPQTDKIVKVKLFAELGIPVTASDVMPPLRLLPNI